MASNVSSSSKKRKKGHYCCVVGCHRESLRDRDEVSFFRFPAMIGKRSNPEKRQMWIKAVNRKNDDGSDWEPKEWTRICSDHFVGDWHRHERNHPDYKPSIFPTCHTKPSSEVDMQRHERARKRILRDTFALGPPARIAKRDEDPTDNEVSQPFEPDIREEPQSIGVQADLEYEYSGFEFSCEHISDPGTASKSTASTYISSPTRKEVSVETETQKKADFGQTVEDDLPGPVQVLSFEENQFKAFTGTSKSMFFCLLDAAKAFDMEIRDSRHITRECKLLLCLIKLKLNLSYVVLSSMFCISERSAGDLFGSVLSALKVVAKQGVIWLDRETIKARMPASFRALYPKTRCIIGDFHI